MQLDPDVTRLDGGESGASGTTPHGVTRAGPGQYGLGEAERRRGAGDGALRRAGT